MVYRTGRSIRGRHKMPQRAGHYGVALQIQQKLLSATSGLAQVKAKASADLLNGAREIRPLHIKYSVMKICWIFLRVVLRIIRWIVRRIVKALYGAIAALQAKVYQYFYMLLPHSRENEGTQTPIFLPRVTLCLASHSRYSTQVLYGQPTLTNRHPHR